MRIFPGAAHGENVLVIGRRTKILMHPGATNLGHNNIVDHYN